MSVIIDSNLVKLVTDYTKKPQTLDQLIATIQKRNDAHAVIAALIEELARVSYQSSEVFRNIKYTQPIITLYGTLEAIHLSNLDAAHVDSVGQAALFGQKRSHALPKTSTLLSSLFASATSEFTEECFEPIKSHFDGKEQLSLTITKECPSIVSALETAQKVLAPIKTLTIETEFVSNATFMGILKACPDLTILRARSTSITDTDIQALCDQCKDLRVLDLTDCQNVDYIDLMKADFPATVVDISYVPCWQPQVETVKEQQPSFMRFWSKQEAAEYAPQNNLEDIRACMKLESSVESPVALTMGAVALLESTDPEKAQALTWLQKALELNAQFIPAAVAYVELMRQGCYQIKADAKAGIALLDRLLRQFPEHPRLLACKARYLIDQQKYDEAGIHARDAYKEDAEDDFVLATYANCLRLKNNIPLATVLSERAAAINPHNGYATTCKAVLNEIPNAQKAEELFRKALSFDLYNQSALVGLAHLLFVKHIVEGDHKEAIKLLQTALQANPQSARAHFTLAQVYEKLGEKDAAQRHYEEAYKIDPTNHLIVLQYGEFLRESAPEKSAELLEEAKSLSDSDVKSQPKKRKGVVEQDKLDSLEDAYKNDPTNGDIATELGILLLPIDAIRAEEMLENASTVRATLALAKFLAVSDPKKAKKLLKGISGDDISIEVHIEKARSDLMRSKLESARKYVNAALAIDENNIDALLLKARMLLIEDEESSEIEEVAEAVEPMDQTGDGVEDKDVKEATEILIGLITGRELTSAQSLDLFALLCECPLLLGDKRKKAFSLLEKNLI